MSTVALEIVQAGEFEKERKVKDKGLEATFPKDRERAEGTRGERERKLGAKAREQKERGKRGYTFPARQRPGKGS